LENGSTQAAVALWRLYFETGHWHRGFLIDRMTGSGRLCAYSSVRFPSPAGNDQHSVPDCGRCTEKAWDCL